MVFISISLLLNDNPSLQLTLVIHGTLRRQLFPKPFPEVFNYEINLVSFDSTPDRVFRGALFKGKERNKNEGKNYEMQFKLSNYPGLVREKC